MILYIMDLLRFMRGNLTFKPFCNERNFNFNSSSLHDKIEFVHIQSIKDKIPSKTEFSILPSSDLLLYVLTNNPLQPLLVYGFNGINNFNETVVSSTTVTNGVDMTSIKIDQDVEILSIISKNNEVVLIEAVMKKY